MAVIILICLFVCFCISLNQIVSSEHNSVFTFTVFIFILFRIYLTGWENQMFRLKLMLALLCSPCCGAEYGNLLLSVWHQALSWTPFTISPLQFSLPPPTITNGSPWVSGSLKRREGLIPSQAGLTCCCYKTMSHFFHFIQKPLIRYHYKKCVRGL